MSPLETWEAWALALLFLAAWIVLGIHAMSTSGEDPFDRCPPDCPECKRNTKEDDP